MILETLAISLSNLINFMWTCVAKPKRRTIWIPHLTTRSLFKSCHFPTLAYFCSMSYSWEVLDTNLISSVYLVVHSACLLPVLYSMSANKSWFHKLSYLILIAWEEIEQFDFTPLTTRRGSFGPPCFFSDTGTRSYDYWNISKNDFSKFAEAQAQSSSLTKTKGSNRQLPALKRDFRRS